jgi:hypothetical protein
MSPQNDIPPAQLFKHWQHSFEEDHGDVQVFRPAEYPFPPARGRAGLEFRPDGTSIRYAIGRGDAPSAQPGRWQMTGQNRLQLQSQGGSGGGGNLEIVRVDDSVLEVRQW